MHSSGAAVQSGPNLGFPANAVAPSLDFSKTERPLRMFLYGYARVSTLDQELGTRRDGRTKLQVLLDVVQLGDGTPMGDRRRPRSILRWTVRR